jgi:CRISPR/Cas system-associated exonuclease Cas4 (RecB family)
MSREIIAGLGFKKKSGLDANAISQAIEAGYLAQRRGDKVTTKKTFAPSTIGYGHGNCARYWYHGFDGVLFEDTTDALGVANMAYGTDAHTRIQKILEDQGMLVAAEVEITLQDPPIRGYMDALVRWKDEVVVAEIKTTRQESFVFKQVSGKGSPNHMIQLLIYLKATGKQKGFLLYENKNDQSFLVVPVEMTPANEAKLESVLEWLRTVRKAWEDQDLPNRPFRSKKDEDGNRLIGKVCQSCPVRKACWEDSPEGTNKISKMEMPTF